MKSSSSSSSPSSKATFFNTQDSSNTNPKCSPERRAVTSSLVPTQKLSYAAVVASPPRKINSSKTIVFPPLSSFSFSSIMGNNKRPKMLPLNKKQSGPNPSPSVVSKKFRSSVIATTASKPKAVVATTTKSKAVSVTTAATKSNAVSVTTAATKSKAVATTTATKSKAVAVTTTKSKAASVTTAATKSNDVATTATKSKAVTTTTTATILNAVVVATTTTKSKAVTTTTAATKSKDVAAATKSTNATATKSNVVATATTKFTVATNTTAKSDVIATRRFDPELLSEAAVDIRAALATGKATTGQDHVLTFLERNQYGGILIGVSVAPTTSTKSIVKPVPGPSIATSSLSSSKDWLLDIWTKDPNTDPTATLVTRRGDNSTHSSETSMIDSEIGWPSRNSNTINILDTVEIKREKMDEVTPEFKKKNNSYHTLKRRLQVGNIVTSSVGPPVKGLLTASGRKSNAKSKLLGQILSSVENNKYKVVFTDRVERVLSSNALRKATESQASLYHASIRSLINTNDNISNKENIPPTEKPTSSTFRFEKEDILLNCNDTLEPLIGNHDIEEPT